MTAEVSTRRRKYCSEAIAPTRCTLSHLLLTPRLVSHCAAEQLWSTLPGTPTQKEPQQSDRSGNALQGLRWQMRSRVRTARQAVWLPSAKFANSTRPREPLPNVSRARNFVGRDQ